MRRKDARDITTFLLKIGSLIQSSFAELTTSQFDLFSVSASLTSLDDRSSAQYHPMSVLTVTEPIQFTISAEKSNCIDFANTFLYVCASMTAPDGDLEANVEIIPECNFLHTSWS